MPSVQEIFGKVDPSKSEGAKDLGWLSMYKPGAIGIGAFLSALIWLIYIIAGLYFAFMMFWGALDWIASGGEKDKVANARNKLTHAVIGLLILSSTFAVLKLLSQFTGIPFFAGTATPSHGI